MGPLIDQELESIDRYLWYICTLIYLYSAYVWRERNIYYVAWHVASDESVANTEYKPDALSTPASCH